MTPVHVPASFKVGDVIVRKTNKDSFTVTAVGCSKYLLTANDSEIALDIASVDLNFTTAPMIISVQDAINVFCTFVELEYEDQLELRDMLKKCVKQNAV